MRRPDEEELSDDVTDVGEVGAGFGAVVDLRDGYGTYDEGFDDYGDESESSLDDSFDDSSDDSFDDGFGEGHSAGDPAVTEAEAEAILVDVLEEDYGSEADEVVDEMQEATGMSALELLEDITGIDLDGSESSSDAGSGFDALEMPEAEAERPEPEDASD